MGADCKSVGFAFEGSNPSPATSLEQVLIPALVGQVGSGTPTPRSNRGTALERHSTGALAVRTNPATPSEVLSGGHAITVVTWGASGSGTTANPSRRLARADSGSVITVRSRSTSWSTWVRSRSSGPGPSG
jgi:hypothetical protein